MFFLNNAYYFLMLLVAMSVLFPMMILNCSKQSCADFSDRFLVVSVVKTPKIITGKHSFPLWIIKYLSIYLSIYLSSSLAIYFLFM